MKRLLPALLLSAAAHTFAADTLRAIPAQAPAGFPFAVETQILSENTYQVKITDRKTGKAQIIEDIVIFPGYIQGNTGSPVDIRDYNGDGHPDIAVRVIGGYTLPADDLYLFNPATRQFEPVPEAKTLPTPAASKSSAKAACASITKSAPETTIRKITAGKTAAGNCSVRTTPKHTKQPKPAANKPIVFQAACRRTVKAA